MVNQLNYHFSNAIARTCAAADCNKTNDGAVSLQKFFIGMKDTRLLLSVSLFWSSVLFERLLLLSHADICLSKSNIQHTTTTAVPKYMSYHSLTPQIFRPRNHLILKADIWASTWSLLPAQLQALRQMLKHMHKHVCFL